VLLLLRHFYFHLFNLLFSWIDFLGKSGLLFAVRFVKLLLHHFFHGICINARAFHLIKHVFSVVGESAINSSSTTILSEENTEL